MKPRFLPRQLIEVTAYNGITRPEMGEVFMTRWNVDRQEWMYHVRCFVREGEPLRYRIFADSKLQAV